MGILEGVGCFLLPLIIPLIVFGTIYMILRILRAIEQMMDDNE